MVNDVEDPGVSDLTSKVKSMSVGSSSSDMNNNNNKNKHSLSTGDMKQLKRHQSLGGNAKTEKPIIPFEQFRSKSCPNGITPSELARMRWKWATHSVKHLVDPWAVFHIDSFEAEKCMRHSYSPIKKEWTKEECIVKMQPKKFEQGAMRACFRL